MLRKKFTDQEMDRFEERIRTILPYDEPIDLDDPSLISRCWEHLHHHKVARAFPSLVDRRPTLEEIEWYPLVLSDEWESQGSCSLWKLKVHKGRSDTSRRVTTCRFTCYGLPLGESPSLDVLVGEELRRAQDARLWRR